MRVAKAVALTLCLKNNKRRHQRKAFRTGFTLLEMLLVIALVGLLFGAVLPRTTHLFRVSTQSSVRRFSALIRFAYDQAVLTGKVHRVSLDLDNATWSVEVSDSGELPEAQAALDDQTRPWGSKDSKDKDSDPSKDTNYRKVDSSVVASIPSGVQIVEVRSWRLPGGKAKKGKASLFAFPNGFVDESTVVLSEIGKEDVERFEVTVVPLTGRTKINILKKAPER